MPDTLTLLTAAGVFVAMLSALYARWSSVAARQSATIARTTLVATQRAFVFAPQIDTLNIIDPATFLLQAIQIVPTWRNVGLTPARRLVASVDLRIFALDEDPNFSFELAPQGAPRFDVAPQASFQGNVFVVPLEDIQKIVEKKAKLYIWGACEYDDVFDNTPQHLTMYCFEADVAIDPLVPISQLNKETKFLRFRGIAEHNTAT